MRQHIALLGFVKLRFLRIFTLFITMVFTGCGDDAGSTATTENITASSVASWNSDLPLDERLQSYLDSLDTDNRAGIALAVTHNGNVIFEGAKGMANLNSNIALTEHTGLRIASISKTFTAVAIMQLVEAGKINLHDSILTYIPELPATWSAITLSMLLTHRSGIFDLLNDNWLLSTHIGDMTNDDAITYFQENPALEFTPDARAEYSNTGYMMLATIIERASGTAFGDYMQDHLFKPAGMLDSYINNEKHPLDNDDALNHGTLTTFWGQTYYLVGSMGQVSSVHDFIQFFSALTKGQLLSEDSLAQLIAPRSMVFGNAFYGYGVMLSPSGYGHAGSLDGFQTDFKVSTNGGYSYVVLTNGGGRTRGYLEQVLKIIEAR